MYTIRVSKNKQCALCGKKITKRQMEEKRYVYSRFTNEYFHILNERGCKRKS